MISPVNTSTWDRPIRASSRYDISGCVGLGQNGAKHTDAFAKIALLEGRQARTPVPTEAREEQVAGCVGQQAPFFACGACRDWITPEDGNVGLPAEDLTEPPLIAQLSRQSDSLFDVRVHCLGVERGGPDTGRQDADQQGRIVELPGHRKRLFSSLRVVGRDRPRSKKRLIGECPGVDRRGDFGTVGR